jgi:protein TonB
MLRFCVLALALLWAPSAPAQVTTVTWAEQPSAQDYAEFYPPDALRRGVRGAVALDCLVVEGHRLNCAVLSEDPPGEGFGAASLAISSKFRIADFTTSGQPTMGGRVRRTIRWSFVG